MHKSSGYIALASILVILVILIAVGSAVTLLSISVLQESLSFFKASKSWYLVDSCAETALFQLYNNNSLPTAVTLPTGTCGVTINSHTSTAWDFTVTGTLDNYPRTVTINLNRVAQITINSWREN